MDGREDYMAQVESQKYDGRVARRNFRQRNNTKDYYYDPDDDESIPDAEYEENAKWLNPPLHVEEHTSTKTTTQNFDATT